MRPLSPTKLKQTPIYTISTHPNVLFFQLYLIPTTIMYTLDQMFVDTPESGTIC